MEVIPKYSIILPTYNEKDNLPICVWLIEKYLSRHKIDYEVIIVDDNSPDGTIDVGVRLQIQLGESKIVLKSRPGKMGLGTAYIYGLKFARGEFIILMDADLSHHPKFIPQMIELQKKTGVDYLEFDLSHFFFSLFRLKSSREVDIVRAEELVDGICVEK